jgi:hypothetical protein
VAKDLLVHFNAGVMVVTPDLHVYDQLIAAAPNTPSYNGGEQGFLNYMIPFIEKCPFFEPMYDQLPPLSPEEDARVVDAWNSLPGWYAELMVMYSHTSSYTPLPLILSHYISFVPYASIGVAHAHQVFVFADRSHCKGTPERFYPPLHEVAVLLQLIFSSVYYV